MPWETSGDYIRSGHRSPSEFEEGSLRTITLSEQEGIKAVIGKPKGQDTTEVQSYLFDKEKWTLEKAKEWFSEHESTAKASLFWRAPLAVLTEKADPDATIFPWSMPNRFYQKPGRRVVYGTAMSAGVSKNSDEYALNEISLAARSFIGTPLEWLDHNDPELGKLTYMVPQNGFQGINRVLDAEAVDGTMQYVAAVEDPNAQQKISNGEITHTSVHVICRRLERVEGIRKCIGMFGDGLCLIHKDDPVGPALPGTSVHLLAKAINQLGTSARPRGLESGFEVEKTVSKEKENPSSSQAKPTEWTTDYINNLPDSAFAYIGPGGEKDEQGKTTPRDLRHLPFKNAEGNIDDEHLRNALGRLPQTELSDAAKAEAQKKLCAAVKTWNSEHSDNPIESEVCGTEEAGETQEKGPSPAVARAMKTYTEMREQVGGMSVDEIKQKIAELEQRNEDLYKQLEQIGEEERQAIQTEIDVVWAELQAYQEALEAAVKAEVGVPGEGGEEEKPAGPGKPEGPAEAVGQAEEEGGEEPEKDEHGCVVGKETWDGEKCVPIAEGSAEEKTRKGGIAVAKPRAPPAVMIPAKDIRSILMDRRFFTPALKVNAILDLVEKAEDQEAD